MKNFPIISLIIQAYHYRYYRKCTEMIYSDEWFRSSYNLNRVPLTGVLYMFIEVPNETDIDYQGFVLVNRLTPLDELLTEQMLDGIALVTKEIVPSTKAGVTTYLIKVVPVFLLGMWRMLFINLLWVIGLIIVIRAIVAYNLLSLIWN